MEGSFISLPQPLYCESSSLVLKIIIKDLIFPEEIQNWQISGFHNNKPGEVVAG